jgi:dienelactone hydrolase
MPNIVWRGREYSRSLVENLLTVCKYARSVASDICAVADAPLYLMGFSAGGGAVAAAAYESGASKILLMAPSTNVEPADAAISLAQFSGEMYTVVGENDDVVGVETAEYFTKLATRASKKDFIILPDCDHQFRGTVNGQIMSKAPLWAFAGDTTFPSPEGGLTLY